MKKAIPLACLLLAATLVSAQASETESGWVSLFDGESLEGWEQINGTATYEVKDGAIVGTTAEGSPNSFLCTTKDYGDFILEFEVMVDCRLNSGVQIRSQSKPDYRDGRVHGYQVEIECKGPDGGGEAGFIYDEARRGWLSQDREDPEKNDAFRDDEWNHYRIHCEGDRIRTWINGVPIEDLTDDMDAEGFIGLQVHSFGGDTPAWVKWKNIRIQELD